MSLIVILLASAAPGNAPGSSVYYRNCDAARAAGVAPLVRGAAGYRPELDRDNDGKACEPYKGRGGGKGKRGRSRRR